MKITKVSEKIYNIEKDNQTITLTWNDILDMLEVAIYAENGEIREIYRTTERRIENKIEKNKNDYNTCRRNPVR